MGAKDTFSPTSAKGRMLLHLSSLDGARPDTQTALARGAKMAVSTAMWAISSLRSAGFVDPAPSIRLTMKGRTWVLAYGGRPAAAATRPAPPSAPAPTTAPTTETKVTLAMGPRYTATRLVKQLDAEIRAGVTAIETLRRARHALAARRAVVAALGLEPFVGACPDLPDEPSAAPHPPPAAPTTRTDPIREGKSLADLLDTCTCAGSVRDGAYVHALTCDMKGADDPPTPVPDPADHEERANVTTDTPDVEEHDGMHFALEDARGETLSRHPDELDARRSFRRDERATRIVRIVDRKLVHTRAPRVG